MKKKYKKGAGVQLSKNFNSNEFDCRCNYSDCKWTIIDTEHVKKLQYKRSRWKSPVKILSGYRCEKHNKNVGGATRSRHLMGDATDITVKGLTPDEVADSCENFDGLGRYSTFTHIDSRGFKARWNFKKK